MVVRFDCRGIDPADMTVRAAINQIDAAMSSVTEHECPRPVCRVPSRSRLPRGISKRPRARPSTLTILAPTLVTPQPRFDAHGCLIGACISVCRECFRFEHNARVEMHHAFGAETESFPTDGDVSGKTAVEIFRQRVGDARIDALAQRFADVEVLARDAKWHDRPPMTAARTIPAAHTNRLAPHLRVLRAFRPIAVRRRKRLSTISTPQHNIIEGRVTGPRPGTSVSPCAAAPRRQFASPRDILRPFAGRCRCPPRAAFPRWYRRTGLARGFRRRSAV